MITGRARTIFAAVWLAALGACGCDDPPAATGKRQGEVVVFTALDRVYSEPILREFERRTGIVVKPVYDAEAAKTTGLVNRLLARRDDPECDVLWNNEIVQTEALAQQGVLEAYESPAARRFPAKYRDPAKRWTGFAGRVRVMIYNKGRFAQEAPSGKLSMFTEEKYRGQGAIALPYYGTTFTHVGLLRQEMGQAKLEHWLKKAQENGTAIAPGNGAVKELVAAGERSFGLTDTDDASEAMLAGKNVGVVLPEGEVVLIPNTVAVVKGAPHGESARKLVDYLLSAEVEKKLAEMPGAQVPLGEDLGSVKTTWEGLLAGKAPAELPVKKIAADREKTIEMLRGVGMGQ